MVMVVAVAAVVAVAPLRRQVIQLQDGSTNASREGNLTGTGRSGTQQSGAETDCPRRARVCGVWCGWCIEKTTVDARVNVCILRPIPRGSGLFAPSFAPSSSRWRQVVRM